MFYHQDDMSTKVRGRIQQKDQNTTSYESRGYYLLFYYFYWDDMNGNNVSRNGLLYRIKFAQTIACCLQEQ